MNKVRNWKADCRDMSYKGGPWPRDEFLQWEVEGIDYPSGRGNYYQDDAYLVAAAPAMLEALEACRSEIWRLLDAKGLNAKTMSTWPEILLADAAIKAAKGEA